MGKEVSLPPGLPNRHGGLVCRRTLMQADPEVGQALVARELRTMERIEYLLVNEAQRMDGVRAEAGANESVDSSLD